ncbi:MAG: ATP-binding protein [Cyanobacteria bacterium HKST-UBA02]|nr:ATP-binding protein [Cyanobacteria bacterium HKST-UBA02]
MKVAFVGKGGSGKSTLSALFIKHLERQARADVLAIDADINMNLSGLLGVEPDQAALLSRPEVAQAVRAHLKGDNDRIGEAGKFLPTTPPGLGSRLVLGADDEFLSTYMTEVSKEPLINLLTVGTYEAGGIGETCYHSHLFVAENILSHTVCDEDFHVVCDMVAGTDAFAYSMHLQFDAIFLICEPSPESVEVCRLYRQLAGEAGIADLIHLVGNKIEDQGDLDYINRCVGQEPVAWLPKLSSLKRARQDGRPVCLDLLDDNALSVLGDLERRALAPALVDADRLSMLHDLHMRLNGKQWVQSAYGDVSGQIDREFVFPSRKELALV